MRQDYTPKRQIVGAALCFTDSEHLCTARRTCALSCWLTILHGYAFRVFHFLLGTAFHTVGLHMFTSTFRFTKNDSVSVTVMSRAKSILGYSTLHATIGAIVESHSDEMSMS